MLLGVDYSMYGDYDYEYGYGEYDEDYNGEEGQLDDLEGKEELDAAGEVLDSALNKPMPGAVLGLSPPPIPSKEPPPRPFPSPFADVPLPAEETKKKKKKKDRKDKQERKEKKEKKEKNEKTKK